MADFLPAIRRVLAQYRSTDGHITEAEIEAAWEEHARTCELQVDLELAGELQAAVDRAYGALSASQYVGGPTQREAWQTAAEALAPLHTQHTAANPDALPDERNTDV